MDHIINVCVAETIITGINTGQCFRYGSSIYIKGQTTNDNRYFCTKLQSGQVEKFKRDVSVTPLKQTQRAEFDYG